MNFLKKMPIGKKLFTGFSICIVSMLLLSIISFLLLRSINTEIVSMNEDRFPKTTLANEIINQLNQQARSVRNMIIMENKDDIEKEFQAIQNSRKIASDHLKKLENTVITPKGIELIKKIETSRSEYLPLMHEVEKLAKEAKKTEATALLLQKVRPIQLRYMEYVEELITYQTEKMKEAGKKAEQSYVWGSIFLFVISIFISILAFFTSRIIISQITIPINQATKDAVILSSGALFEISNDSLLRSDEIGELARAFKTLLENTSQKIEIAKTIASGDISKEVKIASDKDQLGLALREMSSNLNKFLKTSSDSSTQVKSSAKEIADASQALSQGATESASALEEITSSMHEVGNQVKKNAENSQLAKNLANKAKLTAESGNFQMRKMVESINEINSSSEKISKIIKVIDEIAFQTNLLALNAAVEAARAGKHGKGFAVVAEEVRNLAARSAQAAKETTAMIEESLKKVSEGVKSSQETEKSLTLIVEESNKVTDLVSEISSASNVQSNSVSQIVIALSQIDQVTQRNTASAEESASAAEELSSQAEELQTQINKFKLANA